MWRLPAMRGKRRVNVGSFRGGPVDFKRFGQPTSWSWWIIGPPTILPRRVVLPTVFVFPRECCSCTRCPGMSSFCWSSRCCQPALFWVLLAVTAVVADSEAGAGVGASIAEAADSIAEAAGLIVEMAADSITVAATSETRRTRPAVGPTSIVPQTVPCVRRRTGQAEVLSLPGALIAPTMGIGIMATGTIIGLGRGITVP